MSHRDLSEGEWKVLRFLYWQGTVVSGQLSIVGVSKRQMARLTKRLVERGLVGSRGSLQDARKRLWFLTTQGRFVVDHSCSSECIEVA